MKLFRTVVGEGRNPEAAGLAASYVRTSSALSPTAYLPPY